MPSGPLQDPDVPLCFDTNTVYSARKTIEFLRAVREKFPIRKLVMPTIVIAEVGRKEFRRLGPKFDPKIPMQFLENEDIQITVADFDREAALCHGPFVLNSRREPWAWEDAPIERTSRKSACAARCRIADHLVYIIARRHGALLVTNDKELLKEVLHDGYNPGGINQQELQNILTDPE